MNRRGAILLLVMLGLVGIGRAADTNDFFAQGVAAYRAAQFAVAAQAFEKSAAQEPAAGTLVNFGLAEWQRGQPGRAILSWEQARWLDPGDQRAKDNLQFARELAQLDSPQLDWFETASTWLPSDAWVWLAGASLWLAVGMVALPGIFRRHKNGWHQAVAAMGLGVFLFSLTANIGVVTRAQLGVVLQKSTPLRLTPTRTGEVISTLAAGEPARRLRTRGNYFFIRTANGTGWIAREQLGLICPE